MSILPIFPVVPIVSSLRDRSIGVFPRSPPGLRGPQKLRVAKKRGYSPKVTTSAGEKGVPGRRKFRDSRFPTGPSRTEYTVRPIEAGASGKRADNALGGLHRWMSVILGLPGRVFRKPMTNRQIPPRPQASPSGYHSDLPGERV